MEEEEEDGFLCSQPGCAPMKNVKQLCIQVIYTLETMFKNTTMLQEVLMLHGNNDDRSNRYHPHPHPHQHKFISTERFHSSNSQKPTVITITIMTAALSVTSPFISSNPKLNL